MAEILTESFCERCGSRYTFESAVPRARLRGVKVLSRGLKNFVLDDKTSIDEAMAAARDDTDRSLTSQQLEAFHKTFNFCMQCRQYICPNCWNDGDGRCLTCAPTLGRGILPAPFPHLDPSAGIAAAPEDGLAAAAMNGHTHVADEANGSGLDAMNRLDTFTQPTAPTEMIGSSEVEARDAADPAATAPESIEVVAATDAETPAAAALQAPVAEPEPERFIYDPYDPPPPEPPKAVEPEVIVAAAAVAAEPEVVVEAVVAPEPEVVAEVAAVGPVEETLAAEDVATEAATAAPSDELEAGPERAAALAAETSLLLAGLRPGESLDEALAAFEAEPAADETTEPVVAEAAVEPADEASIDHPAIVAARLAAIAGLAKPEVPVEPGFEVRVEPEAETQVVETPVFVDSADTIAAAPDDVLIEATQPAEAMLTADAPLADEPVEAVPEPVAFVEPLDEIVVVDSVAVEMAAEPEAEPEPAWQAEPLDDIVRVEAVEAAVVEPVIEAQPEAAVVEPVIEAAPEPAAIEAAPEPVAPTVPESPVPESPELAAAAAAAAADDIVAQPTWSILAPDARPVTDVPGPLADAPAPVIEPAAPAAQSAPSASAEPSWPAQPQWPNPQPSSGLPFLGRPVVPTGGVAALWAESSQAVSAPRAGTDKPAGGVQPCTSCGLSLSASARFCRRCGTSQIA